MIPLLLIIIPLNGYLIWMHTESFYFKTKDSRETLIKCIAFGLPVTLFMFVGFHLLNELNSVFTIFKSIVSSVVSCSVEPGKLVGTNVTLKELCDEEFKTTRSAFELLITPFLLYLPWVFRKKKSFEKIRESAANKQNDYLSDLLSSYVIVNTTDGFLYTGVLNGLIYDHENFPIGIDMLPAYAQKYSKDDDGKVINLRRYTNFEEKGLLIKYDFVCRIRKYSPEIARNFELGAGFGEENDIGYFSSKDLVDIIDSVVQGLSMVSDNADTSVNNHVKDLSLKIVLLKTETFKLHEINKEECIKFLSEFEKLSNECEGKVKVMQRDLSGKISVETYLNKLPLLLKNNIKVVFDS